MEQLLLTSLLADDDVGARWGLRSNVDRGVLLDMARHEAAKALGELSGVILSTNKTSSMQQSDGTECDHGRLYPEQGLQFHETLVPL